MAVGAAAPRPHQQQHHQQQQQIPSQDTCDSAASLEEVLASRPPGEHLPVSLLGMADRMDAPAAKVKTEAGTLLRSEASSVQIRDDQVVGGLELFQHPKMLLFQLPACLPAVCADASSEEGPFAPAAVPAASTSDNATGHGAVPSTGTQEGETGEKTIDIDAFRSLQQASEEARSARRRGWPLGAEGHYGRLCVHASGRVSLVVNGHRYHAVPSTLLPAPPSPTISRLVAVDAEHGRSFDFGSISHHLVFIPQIDQLLSQL